MTNDTRTGRDGLHDGWPLAALLVAILAWAIRARDPDFWLPDPWLPMSVVVTVGWLACRRLPRRWCGLIRAGAIVLPVCAILGAEMWAAHRDATIASERMVTSSDALLRFGYRPGAELPEDVQRVQLRINSHGMWDLPRQLGKKAGVFRIALLGDSVPNDSFVPFEKRFHRLLQARLNKERPQWLGDRRVELLNFAVEGYNTLQEERLYERVVRAFNPDLLLWAYVLNDPFTQNGAYRRVGQSFFAYRLISNIQLALGHSICELFLPLYRGRSFDLVVRASFERIGLATAAKTPVRVVVLPLVAPYDDQVCTKLYRQVVTTARQAGLKAMSIAAALKDVDYRSLAKEGDEDDITHPNAAGHQLIAEHVHAWLLADKTLGAAAGEDGL